MSWPAIGRRIGNWVRSEVRGRVRGGGEQFRDWRARDRTEASAADDPAPPADGRDPELAKHYARLEVPYGADFETVRKSYRELMKRYHPDRHATDEGKTGTATEVAAMLSVSYEALEAHLTG